MRVFKKTMVLSGRCRKCPQARGKMLRNAKAAALSLCWELPQAAGQLFPIVSVLRERGR